MAQFIFNDKAVFFSTYSTYRKGSHNICHVERWERYREKLLHKGPMEIIVELRKLPVTKHLMDTFLIDVSMATVSIFAICEFCLSKLNSNMIYRNIDDFD